MQKPEIKIDRRRYNTKEEYQKEYQKEYSLINDTGLVCEAIRRKRSIRKGEEDTKNRRKGFGKCSSKYRVVICPDCESKFCKYCFKNTEIHGCIIE
jgi:hypothetical protein